MGAPPTGLFASQSRKASLKKMQIGLLPSDHAFELGDPISSNYPPPCHGNRTLNPWRDGSH
jgi:hypothetical protein